MACEMSELCKFASLDSCQQRFLWTHNKVDPAAHRAVGLVLQVEDTEKFPHALCLESLDPFSFFLFFRVSEHGPCFTSVEEDAGGKRLVELELVCKADSIAPPDPV